MQVATPVHENVAVTKCSVVFKVAIEHFFKFLMGWLSHGKLNLGPPR